MASTPAALWAQILATEHWSLLATRSQTWNESFARAQMFLSVLWASVIALAPVAEASSLGGRVHRLRPGAAAGDAGGLTTYVRLVAINISHHDDDKGAMATAGWAPSRPCSAMSPPRPRWGPSTPCSPA